MLRSFFSGVAGLRNHQQAMDVIGNNISNVNTPGFKGSRVTFVDTLSQTLQGARSSDGDSGGTNPMQVGLGMTLSAISRDFSQGALQTTGRSLDAAIEGNGFFIVGEGNNYFYTRAGSFSVDDNFNLVTDTGERVYGWIDSNLDGTVQAARDDVGWINLDRRGDGRITNALASATPVVNGPNQGDSSLGSVTTLDTTVSDTWTVRCINAETGEWEVVGDHSAPTVDPTVPIVTGGTFSAPELGSFVINGGAPYRALTGVDTNSNGQSLEFRVKDYGAGGNQYSIEFVTRTNQQNLQLATTDGGSHFVVYLPVDVNNKPTVTEGDVATWLQGQTAFSDVMDVQIDDPATGTVYLDETGAAQNGGPDTTTMARAFSSRNFDGGSGANLGDYFTFTTTAPGGAEVESLTITRDGGVVGIFANGTTETIGQLALASVPNPTGLLSMGQGLFGESPASGSGFPPRMPGTGGTGSISSGFLEMSNVDLTREFTDMIVTQRGFQANSRIITTSDEMLQDLLALKR